MKHNDIVDNAVKIMSYRLNLAFIYTALEIKNMDLQQLVSMKVDALPKVNIIDASC